MTRRWRKRLNVVNARREREGLRPLKLSDIRYSFKKCIPSSPTRTKRRYKCRKRRAGPQLKIVTHPH